MNESNNIIQGKRFMKLNAGSLLTLCIFLSLWTIVLPCFIAKDKAAMYLEKPKCQAGECIPLRDCHSYLHMLRLRTLECKEEISKNTCGRHKGKLQVCCPTHDSRETYFPSTCGYPKDYNSRIFGGEMASIGEFPWMALLGFQKDSSDDSFAFLCGGTLINSRYVLTAAHCLDKYNNIPKKLVVVRLGEHNLSSPRDCMELRTRRTECAPPPIDAKPEKIIIHSEYNIAAKHVADIALLRLDTTIDFKASEGYIAPVCLPPIGFNAEYTAKERHGIAVGWGIIPAEEGSFRTTPPDVPYRVDLPFVQREICTSTFPELFGKTQICAGGEKGKDTCHGDSGGPLLLMELDGPPYKQVGIVSYGKECGDSRDPGAIYTSVSYYRDWIEASIEPW